MSDPDHRRTSPRAGRGRNGRPSTLDRRSSRNRTIVLTMVVLMGLSLVAVPLSAALSGGGDAPEPTAQEPQSEASEGPCPPAPDDVPEVDSATYDEPFEPSVDPDASYRATIETTCGTIELELDAEGAPVATTNLIELAEDGYYEGVSFHRVVPGFVIQAGDPAGTGCGREDCADPNPDAPGYPGYTFDDELTTAEELYAATREELVETLRETAEGADEGLDEEVLEEVPGGYPRGTVAMANAGPDTNGSQFFIAQGDPTTLPGPDYTVLGRVVEGMDVVDDIAASPTDDTGRPREPVLIRDVTVERA